MFINTTTTPPGLRYFVIHSSRGFAALHPWLLATTAPRLIHELHHDDCRIIRPSI